MSKQAKMKYGFVAEIDRANDRGMILLPNGKKRLFNLKSWSGTAGDMKQLQPVQFVENWFSPVNCEIRNLKSAELDWEAGRITYIKSFGEFGFVKLADGRKAFVHGELLREESFHQNMSVQCKVVPGIEGQWFVLAMEKADAKSLSIKKKQPYTPSIGVFTKKGTSPSKHLNEDAFLIQPLAGGELWLLAIADGVSHSRNGWWASDKCMEILWRSRGEFERAFPNRIDRGFMHAQIDEIHQEFLRWRRGAPVEFQQATSTLTFALVIGPHIHYAHCGDSRIYVLDPAKPQQWKMTGLISEHLDDQKARMRSGRIGLTNHIGAAARDWDPIVGATELPKGGLLLLCSDGVVSRDKPKYRKQGLLTTLLGQTTKIQAVVEDVVNKIAALGEKDDLTLIAFRPGGK